ncbi:zinc finger protein 37-like [Entelurus aequoreus]|uniref:zinc finger protein 37-like n=1 Tax=Entelurus aequoreus TaxID=161455 RepID=UPI002B1E5B6E|nr:zinc finger protein 37-like [Entelurus aequoreus]XP_061890083.1 zinc finger protein 37-like [Entelurus aequoreus]
METAKKKAVGGKRCIAAGCSNTNTAGVSLFTFPKDDSQALLWNREVKRTRLDWTTHTKYSVLCSDHFERSCFEEGPLRRVEMGIATARPLVLKKGARPTIFNGPRPGISGRVTVSAPRASASTRSDHPTTSTSGQTVHVKFAFPNRQRKRTIYQIMASTTTASVADAVDEPMAMAPDLPVEEGDQDQGNTRQRGCQTEWVPLGTAPTAMTIICGKKHILPEQQDWTSRMEQDEPKQPHIKEEEEEEPLNSYIKEERQSEPSFTLQRKRNHSSAHIKEEEGEPHSPHIKEEEEEEPLTSYIKEERQSEPSLTLQRKRNHSPAHIKEEEGEPHSPHIKEEEEEHSISQEGEHLEWLEEFPVIGVIVKSEGDEVKGESEEKREAEPPSSSSTQHMTTEADGDHCGGSQADKLLAPLSDSDDITSHSSDTDDEDSKVDKACQTDFTHFTCSHCDKTFKQHSRLVKHMRTHTGERPFSCSVCGKSYVYSQHLNRHKRLHTGENEDEDSTAVNTCHTDNTHLKCSQGDTNFKYHCHLKVHMRIHTGEKPFPCSICGQCFTRRPSLERHMRLQTGEKPFSCSICGKEFALKHSLKTHMRIHTGEKPFSCPECGNGFAQKSHLKKHMRTHTGEKTFFCLECGRAFGRQIALKEHMKIHTRKKPFSCSSCGKDFVQRQTLKRHIRTHR